MSEKDQLREHAIAHLERLQDGVEDPESTIDLFYNNVPLKEGQVVALFWPLGKEIDSRYLIDDLIKRGFTVALPVSSKTDRVMKFAKWDGKGDLVKGDFGIFIPPVINEVAPDVVVVPFLAFDRRGNRLGRGAGHYDATLEALRKKRSILAVGLGYASQAVLFNLPAEPHDQRLDMVVTPNGVHDFRS